MRLTIICLLLFWTAPVVAQKQASNQLMATPAIAGGMMFVRAERDLFAIGR